MEQLVMDELWRQFEPLIPKHRTSALGGRPRVDDRQCLEGLVYVLRTGVPWHLFPDKQFGISKSTCFKRLGDWSRQGVFAQTHHALLDQMGLKGLIDLSTAVIDSASVRACFGGRIQGPVRLIAAKMAANAMSLVMHVAHRC